MLNLVIWPTRKTVTQIREVLCVCMGFQTLGVTIHFRRFSFGVAVSNVGEDVSVTFYGIPQS
jgi:hypothetical protein